LNHEDGVALGTLEGSDARGQDDLEERPTEWARNLVGRLDRVGVGWDGRGAADSQLQILVATHLLIRELVMARRKLLGRWWHPGLRGSGLLGAHIEEVGVGSHLLHHVLLILRSSMIGRGR